MTAPRILVVDDEADLRELLEITLRQDGPRRRQRRLAWRRRASYLARDEYALVITDMRLPDGLGLELVREVAPTHDETLIAVITAYGSAENAVAALKAGAFDYLTKPVALEQLRVVVQSGAALHRRGRNQTAARKRAAGDGSLAPDRRVRRDAQVRAQIAAAGAQHGAGARHAANRAPARSWPRAPSTRRATRADKPVRRRQLRRDPGSADGSRVLRLPQGRVHRRRPTTATASSRRPTAARCSSTRSADLPLAMQVKLLRAIQERRVRTVGVDAGRAGRRAHRSAPRTRTWPTACRRALPPGPVLPPERDRDCGCRRCASGARTCRRCSPTRMLARLADAGIAGAALSPRGAASALRAIRFPATCANWRTCSSARWRSPRRRDRSGRPGAEAVCADARRSAAGAAAACCGRQRTARRRCRTAVRCRTTLPIRCRTTWTSWSARSWSRAARDQLQPHRGGAAARHQLAADPLPHARLAIHEPDATIR